MSLISGSVRELTNARPMDVALVDANGDQLVTIDTNVTGTVDVNVTNAEVPVTFAAPSTASLSQVASSNTSVTLLAANPNRKKFIIYNGSGKTLYVAFSATATTTAFSLLVSSKTLYESELNDYTGVISGIWNGNDPNGAVITELTA